LYQAPSQDFPTGLVDPCEGVSSTDPSPLAVNCRNAPGVAANMAANGGIFTLNQADQQGISGYNRGNPNLDAETGRSTTVGLVITPRSIPLLSRAVFTLDYFKIKIADAIVSTNRQYALDQCYNMNNPDFCSFITRRPAAVGNLSAGSIRYSDIARAWRTPGCANYGNRRRRTPRKTMMSPKSQPTTSTRRATARPSTWPTNGGRTAPTGPPPTPDRCRWTTSSSKA
jgi:hypothetical protein